MINELFLLKLNPENASTKQKIISVLGIEWPLTAKQIYERVQKEYAANISYQAVHKVLKELEEANVLGKEKNGYCLSLDWIQKSKKSLEDLEKQYLQNKKIKLPENFYGSIEIEFDNFTDLCISVTELFISGKLKRKNSSNELFAILEYGWWPFKFDFNQFELLFKMVKANPKSVGVIRKRTPFGEWILSQYLKIGASSSIGVTVDVNEDLILQDNYILEIKFSEETKKSFEHYFNKWKNIEDVFKEFGLRNEPKISATLRITKNPELAAFMRGQLEKVFDKSVQT